MVLDGVSQTNSRRKIDVGTLTTRRRKTTDQRLVVLRAARPEESAPAKAGAKFPLVSQLANCLVRKLASQGR
jgi:hypothetical protein